MKNVGSLTQHERPLHNSISRIFSRKVSFVHIFTIFWIFFGFNNLFRWWSTPPPSLPIYVVRLSLHFCTGRQIMLWDLLQVGIAKDRKTDWDKISIFPQISFDGSPSCIISPILGSTASPCLYFPQVMLSRISWPSNLRTVTEGFSFPAKQTLWSILEGTDPPVKCHYFNPGKIKQISSCLVGCCASFLFV